MVDDDSVVVAPCVVYCCRHFYDLRLNGYAVIGDEGAEDDGGAVGADVPDFDRVDAKCVDLVWVDGDWLD